MPAQAFLQPGPRCSHACCLHPADAPTHPTLLLMQNLSPKDIAGSGLYIWSYWAGKVNSPWQSLWSCERNPYASKLCNTWTRKDYSYTRLICTCKISCTILNLLLCENQLVAKLRSIILSLMTKLSPDQQHIPLSKTIKLLLPKFHYQVLDL